MGIPRPVPTVVTGVKVVSRVNGWKICFWNSSDMPNPVSSTTI